MSEKVEGQEPEVKDALALQSPEELFGFAAETYEEAEQRALEESASSLKVEYFRPEKLGTYALRFAPIAPEKDGKPKRGGYEWPAHTMLMKINNPKQDAKAKPFYVSVARATECGFSVDVIDTYRKLAVAEAKTKGDTELADKIAGGNFGGGLKYDYKHFAYVMDMEEKAKGFQLYEMSHGQFKDLDDSKRTLWKKLLAKNPKAMCPISHFKDAYVVELEKKKDGSKTVYKYTIDTINDMEPLSVDELQKLLAAPRIHEVVFRYNRRHHEAVQAFLKQCDADYGLDIFNHAEVQEAIATINSELPATDTSSFSFEAKDAEPKMTLDDLYTIYDELEEKGLGDKTEEGQELRSKIREFMKENGLEDAISIVRSTTNIQILDALAVAIGDEAGVGSEAVQEDNAGDAEAEQMPEPEPEAEPDTAAPRERRSREGRPSRR